jgi:hypothetical protein
VAYPQGRIIVDGAHFDDPRMIAPIANALEPGKTLFGSLDCPLAAPRTADNDCTLTGPHDGIESGEFVEKAHPVNQSSLPRADGQLFSQSPQFLVGLADLTERPFEDLGITRLHRCGYRLGFTEAKGGCEIIRRSCQAFTELV